VDNGAYLVKFMAKPSVNDKLQFIAFARTIDSRFERHDFEGEFNCRVSYFVLTLFDSRVAFDHRRFCGVGEGAPID
jgi:hypothetical protein